jgi:hypothetical protein
VISLITAICVNYADLVAVTGPPIFKGISDYGSYEVMTFAHENRFVTVYRLDEELVCHLDSGKLVKDHEL